MQSGNGMTMQEAEQEIKYYQKIFQVARLLKGEDVERTFYQQGKGTVSYTHLENDGSFC